MITPKQEIITRLFTMIGRLLVCLLLWPVYLFSCLLPRSRTIRVFGSFRGNFVDNSKYLFLHLNGDEETGIRCIWICEQGMQAAEMRKKGYRAYTRYSLGGIYYCLRASMFIYSWSLSDINFWLSGGATTVSLWHGLPFKKIGLDNNERKVGLLGGALKNKAWRVAIERFLNPVNFVIPHYQLSSNSPEVAAIFERTFPSRNILRALYPRVEHFVYPDQERDRFISGVGTPQERELIEKARHFAQVWVYMPTFRDHKADDQRMYSQDVFDFEKLAGILERKNILLLVKYHYVALAAIGNRNVSPNIIFLDPRTDMYMVLPYTSGLITDYSSVFFDYMLLRKPIVFYNFDLQSYQDNSREFYFPYNEATCGRKISRFVDLCEYFDSEDYAEENYDYESYIERFWGKAGQPGLAAQLTGTGNIRTLRLEHTMQTL